MAVPSATIRKQLPKKSKEKKRNHTILWNHKPQWIQGIRTTNKPGIRAMYYTNKQFHGSAKFHHQNGTPKENKTSYLNHKKQNNPK